MSIEVAPPRRANRVASAHGAKRTQAVQPSSQDLPFSNIVLNDCFELKPTNVLGTVVLPGVVLRS